MLIYINESLVKEAAIQAKLNERSINEQIEYWVQMGRCGEENQNHSFYVVRKFLLAKQELDSADDGPPPYN